MSKRRKNVVFVAELESRFVKMMYLSKIETTHPMVEQDLALTGPSSRSFSDSESEDVCAHAVTQPRVIFLGYKHILWFNNVSPNSC